MPCSFGNITLRTVTDPAVSALDWSLLNPSLIRRAGGGTATTSVGSAMAIGQTGSGRAYSICGGVVSDLLQATRPASTKLFVLSLIGIPLLLIVLLALRLSEGAERSTDGLVGVIAICSRSFRSARCSSRRTSRH